MAIETGVHVTEGTEWRFWISHEGKRLELSKSDALTLYYHLRMTAVYTDSEAEAEYRRDQAFRETLAFMERAKEYLEKLTKLEKKET